MHPVNVVVRSPEGCRRWLGLLFCRDPLWVVQRQRTSILQHFNWKLCVVQFNLFSKYKNISHARPVLAKDHDCKLRKQMGNEKHCHISETNTGEDVSIFSQLGYIFSDSWMRLSVYVCVRACAWPLRQEICRNVVIKEMMRDMLMGPPGLSKHINGATVHRWCTGRPGFTLTHTHTLIHKSVCVHVITFMHICTFVHQYNSIWVAIWVGKRGRACYLQITV